MTAPLKLDLVCAVEAAAILGVSRQRVAQLRDSGRFPEPVAITRSGAIWLKADVERFAAIPRPTGRPSLSPNGSTRES